MGRISIAHLAAAINKVRAMDMAQRVSLAEEISAAGPHMLASCLVQTRLGLDASAVDILLNILLVCYQAMKESGIRTPVAAHLRGRTRAPAQAPDRCRAVLGKDDGPQGR
jgi:hypothetical protein